MRVGWKPFSSSSSIAVLIRNQSTGMLPRAWYVQYTNEATLVVPATTPPNVLACTGVSWDEVTG